MPLKVKGFIQIFGNPSQVLSYSLMCFEDIEP